MKNWRSTRDFLTRVAIPTKTASYTPIPHSVFLTEIKDELEEKGYQVVEERYLATANGHALTGCYRVTDHRDKEMMPSIVFVNSYNKTRRAEIRASGTVLVCKNGMMGEVDNGYYSRKHTGNALEDFRDHIKLVINGLEEEFNRLITNKEEMKSIHITEKQRAQMVGDILINEELISPDQLAVLMQEIKQSEYEVFRDDTLWSFYNHVTKSFNDNHPLKYDKQHVKFHTYVCDMWKLTGSRGLFGQPLFHQQQLLEEA